MRLTRYFILEVVLLLAAVSLVLGLRQGPVYYWPLVVLGPLALVGLYDMLQTGHSILRNYPIIGHIRFLLESIRPEIRQYLVESDREPVPFSREARSLVYRRAKNVLDKQPFGTVLDVNAPGYGWISHSMRAIDLPSTNFRITIGAESCAEPYSASVMNCSGMSFGAISPNAIRALNKGAKLGGFAQNTGEGSISRYHRQFGGDIIWQVASGYFGCRTKDGKFDPEAFARVAKAPQVKMIEVKLSQGAKPGHGGVLPRAKISPEIARTRGVSRDRDCISPPAHSAFTTPLEFVAFLGQLRELSGGKPVGFKLCVGHRFEFLAIVKAMIEKNITPDFIVVDGKEGGTGAAPVELTNHVGLPLMDGLIFVRDALIAAGLRDRIKIGASGKLITAYDVCRTLALGADYVMCARGFMFSLGCIQARSCHTNHCPTGVATQEPFRQRALVVTDKAKRVANFHKNTLRAIGDVISAAGLSHPSELRPWHLHLRHQTGEVLRGEEAYPLPKPGALLDGAAEGFLAREWKRAQTASFHPLTDH
jgi:glutamate synthase domain-containing protein 2